MHAQHYSQKGNTAITAVIIIVIIAAIAGYFLLQSSEESKLRDQHMSADTMNDQSADMEHMDSEDSMMPASSADRQENDNAMMEEEDLMMKEDTSMNKTDETMMKDDHMMESSAQISRTGTYEAYDASKLSLADTGDVVLFFHAGWCPTCRALETNINAHLSDIPDNTHILKIDYDTATELKKKYGITYQHTFVQVDSQGNQIKKWSGSPTLNSLLSEIQ